MANPSDLTNLTTALIIVDVQYDFCPGGSLATTKGDDVAEGINNFLQSNRGDYAAVVTTQDWHIDPGTHFSESPDFVDSWPVHCVADSHGAQLHEALTQLTAQPADAAFRKGQYEAAYSGFEGTTETGVQLAGWLREKNIEAVDIVGIATDHCVRATALDALQEGFSVRILKDLCSPVSAEREIKTLAELEAAGARVE